MAGSLSQPPLEATFVSLFKADDSGVKSAPPILFAKRYRLVGTMVDSHDAWKSAAFIEERTSSTQKRYRQGDRIGDDGTIQSIGRDEVWIRGPTGPERLIREGGQMGSAAYGKSSMAGTQSSGAARFGGEMVGENKWHFKRSVIIDYYQELLERPERLVKVFDSLAPVYNDQRRIEGYRVQIEGEDDFFKAVGLQPGDVVRRVNAIEMTNRYRAENLIRRFAQDDLDVVVIELERNGETIEQTYHTD